VPGALESSPLTASCSVVPELWVEGFFEVEASPLVEVLPLVLVSSNVPCQDNQIVDESIANTFVPHSILKGSEHNIVLNKHIVGVEKTNSSIVVVVERTFLHIRFLVAHIAVSRVFVVEESEGISGIKCISPAFLASSHKLNICNLCVATIFNSLLHEL